MISINTNEIFEDDQIGDIWSCTEIEGYESLRIVTDVFDSRTASRISGKRPIRLIEYGESNRLSGMVLDNWRVISSAILLTHMGFKKIANGIPSSK